MRCSRRLQPWLIRSSSRSRFEHNCGGARGVQLPRGGARGIIPASLALPLHAMPTIIRQADLIESVAAALQYISYYHPADYISHLARAYEREQSAAAKDAIAQILTNSKMCAEGRRPICQDTGIVNVFLKIGMDVRWEGFTGSIEDAVNDGVRRGYLAEDNRLRASI